MHFEFQFLDITFHLTIFSLFLYKIFSFFKQYIIPYLYEQIKNEKDFRLSLIEKENLLISKQHKIETQIRHQQALFGLLENNVKNWQNFLIIRKQEKEKELNNIKTTIETKRAVQQKNYETICISKIVMPTAIDLAEQELINKYANPETGEILFNNLIEKLVKNNHIRNA